ncbi:MAG TPA: hypothetical protein PLJ35_05255 [Anaerolineae bacterium]|nr:hypothetical protein [Anaerolineae bacterium]
MPQQLTVSLTEQQFRVLWEQVLRCPKSEGEAFAVNVIGGLVERQLVEQKQEEAKPAEPPPPPAPPPLSIV